MLFVQERNLDTEQLKLGSYLCEKNKMAEKARELILMACNLSA